MGDYLYVMRFLWILLSGFTCVVAAPNLNALRLHFEWAEYDSLLVKAPPLADDPYLAPEEKAKLWNYLGVARFMRGDSLLAVKNYHQALEWSDEVRLDRFFVSPEAHAHYLRALETYISREEKSEANASIPTLAPSPSAPKNAWIASPFLAGFCFAASAGLGYFSYAAYQRGEDMMPEWRTTQDRERWNELLAAVRREDTRALVFGGASVLAFGAGSYWVIRRMFREKPEASQVSLGPEIKSSFRLYGAGTGWEYTFVF